MVTNNRYTVNFERIHALKSKYEGLWHLIKCCTQQVCCIQHISTASIVLTTNAGANISMDTSAWTLLIVFAPRLNHFRYVTGLGISCYRSLVSAHVLGIVFFSYETRISDTKNEMSSSSKWIDNDQMLTAANKWYALALSQDGDICFCVFENALSVAEKELKLCGAL